MPFQVIDETSHPRCTSLCIWPNPNILIYAFENGPAKFEGRIYFVKGRGPLDVQSGVIFRHRVLAVGGLVSFTTFGPDTLRELRSAFTAADRATHVSRFVDMHDLGDMLVHAGFADPVMDMEMLTMTYADASAMMRDLKALGAHNATLGRPRGLMGRGRWRRMLDALDSTRRDGKLPVSFEVIYGHAWKPRPRATADGRAIVHFEPRGRE